jgi:predicted nucleic acid-binding protein
LNFWDSSALFTFLTGQPDAPKVEPLMKADPKMMIWWGTPVELASAAARLRREGELVERELSELLADIRIIVSVASELEPCELVRQTATRLVQGHVLRTADALQLAAALVWADLKPQGMGFVSLDRRLRDAAEREGFTILP